MTVPIPDNVSWGEAGAIQPLAIAVQLGRRAALNAHQTLAILSVPCLCAQFSFANIRNCTVAAAL